MPQVYAVGGLIQVDQGSITGKGAPQPRLKGQLGQKYFDITTSPPTEYVYNGVSWAIGGANPATTTVYGTVLLTDNSQPVATKAYADALAIAGAPAWSEVLAGIGQLSTNAEAIAGTNDDTAMTPLKVAAALVAGLPITGGAGSFTTLAASGLTTLSGSATINTAGTALELGTDVDAAQINIGTSGDRVIAIGSNTAATSVALTSGTGAVSLTTTGAGDILLNSGDTILLDAAGVVEINSSAGVIGIGNDAVAQNINIGTGAAARVITLGNSTGATQVVVNGGTSGVNVGANAIAQTVTIGNQTGASAVVIDSGTGPINIGTTIAKVITIGNVTGVSGVAVNVGTGNFVVNGVATSTYAIGAATTTGTVTIGGTAQTGDIVLGSSSGINAVKIMNGSGAGTLSLGVVQTAGAINMGTAMTTGTITVGGTGLQTGTISIAPGTGAQTVNIATGGTGIKTINIGTGAIGNVVTIGTATAASSLALLAGTGGVTIDSSGVMSLDAAGAVNLTTTGAFDIAINSTAGSVILTGAEGAVDAIQLNATTAGGGIDINAGTGGVTVDTTAAISLDSATASNFTVTGAADLTLQSSAGAVNVISGEANADSINVTSAGGMNIVATGAAAKDTVITNTSGSITLSAGESVIDALNLTAGGAASGINLTAGTNGILLSSGQKIKVTAVVTGVDATPYALLGTDYFVSVDTGAGVMTITLPAAPATGRKVTVYDGGGAAAGSNITIDGNGKNIAAGGSAAATKVINTAYESYNLVYNGTLWLGQNIV